MTRIRTWSFPLYSAGLVLGGLISVAAAGQPAVPAQKPIDNLPAVPLFEAMDAEELDVKLVHKDESSGNLFVQNATDKPINVKMPEAFVGVHVLNQGFFGSGNGNSGFGTSGFGNQSGQGAGQGQGAQTTGGGVSGNNSQNPGIFSVPPGRTVRIPVNTVCLEHGRATPSSRMDYRIFPVTRFSPDPALFALLTTVASGNVSRDVGQAAAWHLASGKSWKELSAMKFRRAGSLPDVPHFRNRELAQARELVEKVQAFPARNDGLKAGVAVTEVAASRRDVSGR